MAVSDPPIRAVIFDYGGVLTTSGRTALREWTRAEGIQRETYSSTLKEWLSRDAPAGTPIHRLETGEIGTDEFNELLAERLRTTDGARVVPDSLITRLFAHMRDNLAMFQLVRELTELGLRTALLSNSWGNTYPWETLNGLFEVSVISGDLGLRKPDPRIYRVMLDKLGLPARETVFIDDGAPNIDIAQRIGMHAILHDGSPRDASSDDSSADEDSPHEGSVEGKSAEAEAAEGTARTRKRLAGLIDGLDPDPAQETT